MKIDLTEQEIKLINKWFYFVYGGYVTPSDKEVQLMKKLQNNRSVSKE